MKKIRQFFNFLFFYLLIYSCTPNGNISLDNEENKILQEMKSIQKDYENKINANSKLRISKRNKFNKIKPEWDYFWQQEFKGQKDKVIIVAYDPISNEDYETKLEDGTMLSYDDATFLKVTKNKGKYEYEVITKIPDRRYLENDGSANNSFTGSIFIYDLFGEFIKGYKITLNQVLDLNIKIDKYANSKSGKIKNDSEYCVDWYTCFITNSVIARNCNYNYTECTVGGTISDSYNSSYGIIGAINFSRDGGTAINIAKGN